jgi:hypothetical protein
LRTVRRKEKEIAQYAARHLGFIARVTEWTHVDRRQNLAHFKSDMPEINSGADDKQDRQKNCASRKPLAAGPLYVPEAGRLILDHRVAALRHYSLPPVALAPLDRLSPKADRRSTL